MKRGLISMLVVALTLSMTVVADDTLDAAFLKAEAGRASLATAATESRAQNPEGAQKAFESSQSAFREAVALCSSFNPDRFRDRDDALRYAVTMELASENDLAARGFARAYQLSPDNADAGISAARNWRMSGDVGLDKALAVLITMNQSGDSEDTSSAPLHSELGRVYLEQGLPDLALEAYRKALEKDATYVDAIIGEGVLAMRNGDLRGAFTRLGALTEMTDEQAQFLEEQLIAAELHIEELRVPIGDQHFEYAMLLSRARRVYEALLVAEHAVMLDNATFATYNLLGGLLMQQGMQERAITAYRKSLEMNPDQARTRAMLEQIQANSPPAQ